jgi:hypothetical protein
MALVKLAAAYTVTDSAAKADALNPKLHITMAQIDDVIFCLNILIPSIAIFLRT